MALHDRRVVLIGGASLVAVACAPRAATEASEAPAFARGFEALEAKAGGRLGAFVLDTETGFGMGWRTAERFAHCSSFKLSLAALFLAWADRGAIDLGERLHWTGADLLPNSEVTRAHLASGLTIEELAHAVLVRSDNTGANVLLKRAGGPPALTRFWRSLGDEVSRLDRYETELNVIPPGTELDSTTPQAMAATLAKLVGGDALGPASRDKLRAWMAEVRTGTRRLRAGLPEGWVVGDKTGTGIGGRADTYVDIAYAGPPGRKPLIITAYFNPVERSDTISAEAEAVLAEVGRVAAASLGSGRVGTFAGEPRAEPFEPRPGLL